MHLWVAGKNASHVAYGGSEWEFNGFHNDRNDWFASDVSVSGRFSEVDGCILIVLF
jgi:hypothetical protein